MPLKKIKQPSWSGIANFKSWRLYWKILALFEIRLIYFFFQAEDKQVEFSQRFRAETQWKLLLFGRWIDYWKLEIDYWSPPYPRFPLFLLMIYIEIANYECHPVSMTSLVEHCCTEVRFSCFLSGGFANMAVINPPESKLTKCTSVHCALKVWSYYCVSK